MQTDIEIPQGLVEILIQFSITVLREKPSDIISFAAVYFGNLAHSQDKSSVHKTVLFKDITPAKRLSTPQNTIFSNKSSDNESVCRFDEQAFDTYKTLQYRRPCVIAERFNSQDLQDDNNEEDNDLNEFMAKSNEQKTLLLNVCKKNAIFKYRDDETLMKVIDVMKCRQVVSGETIVEQDDVGDNFYIIENGVYDAFKSDIYGEETCVQTYYNEGSFGELTLIYNTPRSATVTARTSGTLWYINRKQYLKLVLSYASKQRYKFLDLIHSVKIFQELSPDERMNIADALRTRDYENKDCIIKQGDPGNEIFFILEGSVIIKKQLNDGNEIVLNELQKGNYFGELALLTRKPRAISVYAKGKVTIAYLDADSFERLLGPCIHEMRRNTSTYSDISDILGESSPNQHYYTK
ncbi:unnamed protein product [Heterobilharzia americana]|nr:unnamed protein product [Heterobilharzia americana]